MFARLTLLVLGAVTLAGCTTGGHKTLAAALADARGTSVAAVAATETADAEEDKARNKKCENMSGTRVRTTCTGGSTVHTGGRETVRELQERAIPMNPGQ